MYVVGKFRADDAVRSNINFLFTANKIKGENFTTILFYAFVVLALVSGAMVIRGKNPVHSVLFLILVFCNTSGLLVLLGLDFFAMIFLVVYVGAIAVLFLFCRYDVTYKDRRNSRECIALFTCRWYYRTYFFVGNLSNGR